MEVMWFRQWDLGWLPLGNSSAASDCTRGKHFKSSSPGPQWLLASSLLLIENNVHFYMALTNAKHGLPDIFDTLFITYDVIIVQKVYD